MPLLGVLVFGASLVLGALLHLDLPATRSAAGAAFGTWYSSAFLGTASIERVDRLGAGGLKVTSVEVFDTSGRRTLWVPQIEVDINLFGVLLHVLRAKDTLSLAIDDVRIKEPTIDLYRTTLRDEKGKPLNHFSIADAFTPKPTSKEGESSRRIRVYVSSIRLSQLYARGKLSDELPIDIRVPAAKASLLASNKGVAIDIEKFGLRASGFGGVDTLALGELKIRAPGAISGEVRGQVGTVPLVQKFVILGEHVRIDGNIPNLRPSDVRPLWPGYPLDGRISVENHIEGILPKLNARIDIVAERGRMRAAGLVTTAPELEADLDLDTENLDLSSLSQELPRTSLNLRSAAELWLSHRRVNLELNATLANSSLEGAELPIVDARASYDERGLDVKGTLHERGLPAHFELRGQPPDQLEFSASLRRTRLAESPRLATWLGADGTVEGEVNGTLVQETLQVKFDVSGQALRYAGVTAQALRSTGTARTTLGAPRDIELDLGVEATNFEAAGLTIPKLSARASGPALDPQLHVTAKTKRDTSLTLEATAHLLEPSLESIRGSLGGLSGPVSLSVARIAAQNSRVTVKDLEIQGEGHLEMDLDIGTQDGRVFLDAQGLNVSRLMQAIGYQATPLEGRLDAIADLRLGPASSGSAELTFRDGKWNGFEDVILEARTELSGRGTRGSLSGSVGDHAEVTTTWDVEVPGGLTDIAAFEDWTGRATASLRRVDLSFALERLLGRDPTELTGRLDGHVEIARTDPSKVPDIELNAQTDQLELAAKDFLPSETISGLELNLRGAVKPDQESAQLALRVQDRSGDLLTGSGSLRLPLGEYGKRLPSWSELTEDLTSAPLEGVVVLSRRELGELPKLVSPPDLHGSVQARLVAQGSLDDPRLDLTASAKGLEGPLTQLTRPVDAEANLRFRPSSGRVTGTASVEEKSARIATISLDVGLEPSMLAIGRLPAQAAAKVTTTQEPPLAWTGVIQLFFDGAPLDLIGEVSGQRLGGTLQGSVLLERSRSTPRLDAELRLRKLSIGRRPLGTGTVQARTESDRLVALASFDDEYGHLHVEAQVGTRRTPLFLSPDLPLHLRLRAEDYDAAVISPFARDHFSELSGSLSGELEVTFDSSDPESASFEPRLAGHITLTDGVLTPTAMGLRLSDVQLALLAKREGKYNTLELQSFRAKGAADVHNLRATGKAYLLGLRLDRTEFELMLEGFPLSRKGHRLANVTGKANGSLEFLADATRLRLALGGLHVDLPLDVDRNLIELEENPTIDVVQRPRGEAATSAAGPEVPLKLALDLGRGVRVSNSLIHVVVVGNPSIETSEETSMSGDIEVKTGGRVQVLGKNFVISHGRIMFDNSDVTNPHLDVTATWRSSSGVTVRATIGGTAKDPTVSWSSDPPLPGGESEVVALVIGGGSTGQTGGSGTSGWAYAFAAVLNQALGESGVSNVELHAGRESESSEGQVARLSERAWDSYTASVRISDELWFEGSYRQETAGFQSDPRSGVSGTLEWRFAPNWAARSEAGTLGFGLDLMWQYRY